MYLLKILSPDSENWDNNRELLWQTGSHAELKRKGWVSLRQGDWKYLQTPNQEFLFNLGNDPCEARNLIEREPGRFTNLKNRAHELIAEYQPSPPSGKLVIPGDLMTAAEGVPAEQGFSALLNQIGGESLQVIGQGRSGWPTTSYLKRMDEILPTIPADADWILLQLGVNDLRIHGQNDKTVQQTTENMASILRIFQKKAPKAKLVLVSPPTMVPEEITRRIRDAGFGEQSPGWLAKLASAYEAKAKANDWYFINLHDTLALGHTLDGVHANARGHRRITTTLWQELNRIQKEVGQ